MRHALVEIVTEARRVGIRGAQAPVLQPQRVGRADQLGGPVYPVGKPIGRLLVRDGDVSSDEAASRHVAQESFDGVGRDVDPFIAARDAELVEPMAVDKRRARMRDRVTDDERPAAGFSHR